MKPLTLLLLSTLSILFLSSCRNNSGSTLGPGIAVEQSLAAFSAAFQSVTAALSVAAEQGTKEGEITKFEHVLLCDSEGSSSLSETVSDSVADGTFLVEADLDECNGVKGEISALGNFTRNTDGILYNWDYQGDVTSGDCAVNLDDLSVTSVLQSLPALSLVTGTLTAECLGDTSPITVVCRWSQTPVLSQEDLLAGCH